MPNFDGRGPRWSGGPGAGWGLGPCGFGRGLGFGWGFRRRSWTKKDELAALKEEETMLAQELKAVQEDQKALGTQR